MFKNIKLSTKLNILLAILFLSIILLSGFFLSWVLERNAEQMVVDKALLLIETMGSVRDYTSNQINPLLASRLKTESQFLPQTVPGYSAREVFEGLRKRPEYKDFFYKEAVLNPTNVKRDKADEFETGLVEAFKSDLELKEKSGFRSESGGELFYIARPITISKQSCLECHSTPSAAPKSQLATYGSKNGFGWKLNEIVGVKMVSVPADQVIQASHKLRFAVVSIISFFLLLAIALLNYFLKSTITNPLQNMSKLARQVSTGDFGVEFHHRSNDEIGILANSLNRMKNSLKIMMDMLNSGEDIDPLSSNRGNDHKNDLN